MLNNNAKIISAMALDVPSWLTTPTAADIWAGVWALGKNVFAMSTVSNVTIEFDIKTEKTAIANDGRNTFLGGFSSGAGVSMPMPVACVIMLYILLTGTTKTRKQLIRDKNFYYHA